MVGSPSATDPKPRVSQGPASGPRRVGRLAALGATVVVAVVLRAVNLGWPPLWADEAESAINALTVLASGLPGDRYLGLPIYENALVRPWPESEEYAFRDISYSDRGLATYHGWLPLYAIAAAFRLAGVTPEDARRGTPPADGSTTELVRWTAVPRLPALLFSALLVFFAFRLGGALGGAGADWAMAIATAASGFFVWLGRQARYYSPTLALGAACGLAVWTACRRGRPRDHVLAGLALGILFHTHALSAFSLGLVYAASLPLARDQRHLVSKLLLAASVGALLVLPWAWWSGFLTQPRYVPPARQLLDLGSLRRGLPASLLLTVGLGVAGLAAVGVLRGRLGERWRRSATGLAPGLYFALAWTLIAYGAFVVLVPAPSYWVLRLKLAVAVPAFLLASLVVTALVRALRPGAGQALPALAMLGLLAATGQVYLAIPRLGAAGEAFDMVRQLRSWRLSPQARVYATPNSHLVVTYYAGLPVQSVSSVRKSWLDRAEGDLLILESPRYESLPAAAVVHLARAGGLELGAEEAAARGREARRLATVIDLEGKVRDVHPRQHAPRLLEPELLEATRRLTRQVLAQAGRGTPLERAAPLTNWTDFLQFFFFRFAEPAMRQGGSANFAERVRQGHAYVLPSGWIVYDCRPSPAEPLVPTEAAVAGP